jgi:putative copper resistance protein D
VHLLSAGGWLGGLVPFAMCVAAYADDRLRSDAIIAMRRFSFFGPFVVAALGVTGAVNIALTSGHAPIPPATLYRQLLDVKIALVAIMIALALVNRLVVAPRLARSSNAAAALRATSILEAALGTIAVALVSLFGLLDPA